MTRSKNPSVTQRYDPWAPTQPVEASNPLSRQARTPARLQRSHRRVSGCGCTPFLSGAMLGLIILLLVYLLAPLRTNILLLGIDYTPPEHAVGRTDTIILATVIPLKPYIGLLSIPRDLWITIPGYGENRINTAHFFAEASQAGAGPLKAMETIRANFGVDVEYYLRIRFDGFRQVIDAMGGVDLVLPEPMAGYPAGALHLNGNKALAFVRHRLGSDDFFRMERGQMVLKAALKDALHPRNWRRLPVLLYTASRALDTNIPVWQLPRLGLALLRAGADGIDNHTVSREMVTFATTSDGASILLPDWSKINPVLFEMFGQ